MGHQVTTDTSPLQRNANHQDATQRLAEAERYRRTGKLNQAQSLCESLVNEYPDYVAALHGLGLTYLAKQNYPDALLCFIRAAAHCPNDWINLTNLATAYLRLGARVLASRTLQQARQLKPDDPNIDFVLAEIYWEEMEYELAANAYRKVLSRLPSHAGAAQSLGTCYRHMGQVAEAAGALRKAHQLKPESVAILYGLGQLPSSVIDVAILDALDGVRKLEGQDQDEFDTLVAFTRAAALAGQSSHLEAWNALEQANGREFPKHEPKYQKLVARMTAARKAALQPGVAAAPPRAPQPHPLTLFIVGPSRSGKTTVERLLSAVDGVKCGYEKSLAEQSARRTSQLSRLPTIRSLSELPQKLDDQFRAIYSEEVQKFARGASIITDTYPARIPYIGRIATTLPNVRFIFVKRERYDCALRIFMKRYRTGNHYAYDIKTIFHYLSWYDAMIDIWRQKFPELTLNVDYDNMIADPKVTLARILEFCDARNGAVPPDLGDDRGCSAAYRGFMDAALRRT